MKHLAKDGYKRHAALFVVVALLFVGVGFAGVGILSHRVGAQIFQDYGDDDRDYRRDRRRNDRRDRRDDRDDRRNDRNNRDNDQGYSSDQPQGNYSTKSKYCRELESELAGDWVRGRRSTSAVPDLNKKIKTQDGLFNKFQHKADRMNCYENMFIFGRSLRRTKKCIAIDKKIRKAKRKLVDLRRQRNGIRDSRNSGDRRKQLINKLARNNCGEQYSYEARRNRSSDWGGFGGLIDSFTRPAPRRRTGTPEAIQPYATYRTMCVRLCDGFYYPVSFSTLPSNFNKDEDACRNKCAAPSELFVYRNPGGEIEQMISPVGNPYDGLENAWRFKKEFIKGCSCKPAEYSEQDIEDFHKAKEEAKKLRQKKAAEDRKAKKQAKKQAAEAAKAKKTTKTKKAATVTKKTIGDLIR